jgi:hypothetical protein
MQALQAKDLADRDQLWASLRILHEKIERLAVATKSLDSRQQQLSVLLAQIVLAELDYRARDVTNE